VAFGTEKEETKAHGSSCDVFLLCLAVTLQRMVIFKQKVK